MFYRKVPQLWRPGAVLCAGISALLIIGDPAQSPVAAQQPTSAATAPAICSTSASATPAATQSATLSATMVATTAATAAATLEVTSEATQAADAPVHFISLTPTDIHFNPNADKPVALVTVYSLIFENELDVPLHIQKPVFQLAIDDVPWGAMVSTDFQTGEMQPHATQGIVLQNLTIVGNTTAQQKDILNCLKNYLPVNLTLTGSLDAYPNGSKQSVAVTLVSRQVVLREHRAAQ